jgi:hypothetical protein
MTEPCMCGAIDCRICGPLQGYRVKPDKPDPDDEDVSDDEIHGVEPYSFDKVWREEIDE